MIFFLILLCYINLIKNDKFFAGDFELSESVFLFNINIAVYEKIINSKNETLYYKFINYYENKSKENKKFPLLILSYEPQYKHYQQLLFKNNNNLIQINHISNNLPINLKNNNLIQNDRFQILQKTNDKNINFKELPEEIKLGIEDLIKKYKELSLKKNDLPNNDDYFEQKVKEGYNYPYYPNHIEGKHLLLYIRNYLLKKKLKQKRDLYPYFIINNKNDNIENLKKYFRTISNNYELDSHNNLCIKMPIKNNNETFTKKFNRRKYNNYSLKKVPFVKDLKQFLYQFHSNTNHKGFEAFRKALINDNIYYKGIIKDIQNIIDNCAICKLKNQKINLKKMKNLILFYLKNQKIDILAI